MVVERALDRRRLANHAGRLERELASRGVLGDLIGESAAMQEIFAMLQQAAPAKATILITGESGTGKEIVARAIHQLSPRRAGPFFAVNCAAMPESLIESELFGHEKGAFTGAVERRAGCFELARGGTLLLDEIGDMPMNTQAKLLRILEEGRVRRLGSARRDRAGCPRARLHQQEPGRRHRQRRVSRRPFLPPQRLRGSPAAAAGKEGGHPAAGARAALGSEPQTRLPRDGSFARGAGDFRPLRLARQRAGVAQPAGARRDSGGQRIGDARPPAARFRRTSGAAAARRRARRWCWSRA